MTYYENDCTTHISEKNEKYYLKSSTDYYKKKEARWATWNAKRAKTSHQVNKFSEETESKLKSLRMKWKEMKERMKAISSWWEKKIIYDLKSVAWWLTLMKDSEKHQKSEELKKSQTQTLSSNASEVLIDQRKITEQKEENNSEKVFTEEDEN